MLGLNINPLKTNKMKRILILALLSCMVFACKQTINEPTLTISEKNNKYAIHLTTDSGTYLYDRVYRMSFDRDVNRSRCFNDFTSCPKHSKVVFLTETIDPKTWNSIYGISVNDTVLFKQGEYGSYELTDDGFIITERGLLYRVFDLNKKVIISEVGIKPVYNRREKCFYVKSPAGYVLYTINGEEFGPYQSVRYNPNSNSISYTDKKNIGYINLSSKTEIHLPLDEADYIGSWLDSKKFFYVSKGSLSGVIDRRGQKIIPIKYRYDLLSSIDSNTVLVVNHDSLSYVELNSGSNHYLCSGVKQIINTSNNLTVISDVTKQGVINNKTGKLIIPVQFEKIYLEDSSIVGVKDSHDNKYGEYDLAGNFVGFKFKFN